MRIAQVAPPWIKVPPREYGGTERVLYDLVEEQVVTDNVVLYAPADAVTSASHRHIMSESIIPSGGKWTDFETARKYYESVVNLINVSGHDVGHFHLSAGGDILLLDSIRRMKCPQIVTVHSRFPFSRKKGKVGELDHELIGAWGPGSLPLTAISSSQREDALQFDERLNFLGVVYHGLPLESFPQIQKPGKQLLIWIGRITPDKGLHIGIQAAITAGIPLVIAGVIPEVTTDIDYYDERVYPLIKSSKGLVEYVGPINAEQRLTLLSESMALLNPILWKEPFGLVPTEAMAAGCPVIAFPRGAMPEVVGTRGGVLVQNLDEMVQAIHLVNKSVLYRQSVQDYAREKFSAARMAADYKSLYELAIAQWHG